MAEKVQAVNFRWQQGEDLMIELIYKEGNDPRHAVAVPLNAGYAVRMDLVLPNTDTPVYTLTSDDNDSSNNPDNIILSSGANKTANLTIYLPRAVTLPGGDLYDEFIANKRAFTYDIFLRNVQSNKQTKILRGTISVEDSVTLWQ